MDYSKIAAKWWVDQIQGNVTEQTRNSFEKHLSFTIQQLVERKGFLALYCDYAPCIELQSLSRFCGLDSCALPVQAAMHITPKKVTVFGTNTVATPIYTV